MNPCFQQGFMRICYDSSILMGTLAYWILFGLNLFMLAFATKLILELCRVGRVPPFIRTRVPVADEIAAAFGTLPEGSVVYDPGCGDGRVLFAIAKRNPGVRCVGIEIRLFPYMLAMSKKQNHPEANIEFVRGNCFTQDLSVATHMYVYLYPKVMDSLLPKLMRELKPGTELISLDFKFKKKQPERVIPLASAERKKLGQTLYAYRF